MHKAVLNKMITQELCVKYDFVAPLITVYMKINF